MKKYFFIFLVSCTSALLAQEFNSKWSHGIVGGAVLCLDQSAVVGSSGSSIKYNIPGYVLFYRLIQTKDKGINSITLNANYRSALGSYKSAVVTGISTTSATVNWCRMDIGYTRLIQVGKNKDFGFGPGVYVGGIIFADGSAEQIDSNMGIVEISEKSPNYVLNRAHFGVNIELQQKIDISENGAIIMGLRIGLETPEGFNMPKFTKLGSAYLGYQFAKKKKLKQ